MTEPWNGFALVVSADRAVIGPEAARLVLRLMRACEREARRDGIGLPASLRELRDCLTCIVVADVGQPKVGTEPGVGSWACVGGNDAVTVTEAAQLLGLSERTTRRLAASGHLGPTRRAGRSYLLDRHGLDTYRARKGN